MTTGSIQGAEGTMEYRASPWRRIVDHIVPQPPPPESG